MIITPHWPQPLGAKPIDLGLNRIRELMSRLGDPHLKLPPVVHVAGTNGKGSTIAYLRAFLESAGYKVHAYTSPHLVYFNERILLAGKPISDHTLYDVLETCRKKSDGINLTFFEGTTAAAFLAFSQIKADIVLLETGMGGRLDATNILPKPALTIITPISMDHMEFLGDTLSAIAHEKACIMKREVPCVIAPQAMPALASIEDYSEAVHAPLYLFDRDWDVMQEKAHFIYRSKHREIKSALPALPGEHQILNAGTAIAALDQLPQFTISTQHILQGLQKVNWPARLQKIQTGPFKDRLPEGCDLWLDGGHNEGGAAALSAWLHYIQVPVHLIIGMTEKKDATTFLKTLAPRVASITCTPIPDEDMAMNPRVLYAEAQKLHDDVAMVSSPDMAFQHIAEFAKPPYHVLVCGSLYLAGYLLREHA